MGLGLQLGLRHEEGISGPTLTTVTSFMRLRLQLGLRLSLSLDKQAPLPHLLLHPWSHLL